MSAEDRIRLSNETSPEAPIEETITEEPENLPSMNGVGRVKRCLNVGGAENSITSTI